MSDSQGSFGTKGRLRGKVALVTGGGSGIGRATCRLFAREGAMVSVVDLAMEQARTVAEEICASGHGAMFLGCDVGRSADCANAVRETVERWGRLDILFNNAGMIVRASVVELDEEDWDRALEVNLKSVYLMSRHAVPLMERQGGGVIINTGSGWGLVGGRRAASYCAAKGGVVLLTRAMALDHGAQNIRVNCICPGDTETPMLVSEARQLGLDPAKFIRQAGCARPLGRIGKAEEIAEAVLFLACEASSFVTGTTLVVDGGGLAG